MTDLSKLLGDAVRPNLVNDLSGLVELTAGNQSGLTGMAIKSALAAGKKADADAVTKGITRFLPLLIEALQPFWERYTASQNSSEAAPEAGEAGEAGEATNTNGFGNFLNSREGDVVEALLNAADKSTDEMPTAVQKAYSSVRGKAGKIVGPALPDLGTIIERYV